MYYIVYGILKLFSFLPMFMLYGISDFISFLVYHVFGYRRSEVLKNLQIAFPEKSFEERKKIARKFYGNFIDTFVETVKLLNTSDEGLSKWYQGNVELLNKLGEKHTNIQLHAMHNFNWEVVHLGVARELKLPFLGVYMPIKNPVLEKIFRNMRTRYGTILVPATEFKSSFSKYEKDKYILALVADQSPASPKNAYWVNFFGKPTAFVTGPEKAARLRNVAVVFANFYKVKRGVYTIETRLITENAGTMPEGELTIQYARYVEECIRKRPDNYLWSHRRWKHEYNDDYAKQALEKLNL